MISTLFKKTLEYFSVFLIASLIVIVVMGVGSRMIDISFPWYDELASVILVWLTYIGSAYVALIRGHMSFDGILVMLKGNTQTVVFAISETVSITFFLIVAYYSYLILEVFADETLVTLPWLPLSVTQAVVPIASILFVLARLFAMPSTWQSIRVGQDSKMAYIEDVINDVKAEMNKNEKDS